MAETPTYTEANSAIIERCKNGDRKAFHELYGLYAKAMFNISLRILNNRADAEEVLQDSFVKAFRKIHDYNPEYAYGSWLKKIVVNTSLDALKKKKQAPLSLEEKDYPQVEEPEEEAELHFDVQTIKRCVAELPDGYRTVLVLYLFEEYPHKEIAEMLGISEGTSKSQYNRARKKLIESLNKNKANG